MRSYLAIFAILFSGCADGEQSAEQPLELGTSEQMLADYFGFGQTDDVSINSQWGSNFVTFKYWMSIEVPEPGTGFIVNAECTDQNGSIQTYSSATGDGSGSNAVVGDFTMFKDAGIDCTIVFDSQYFTTSPTFSYYLWVGSPF